MITITEKASKKITSLLKEEGKLDYFVRVGVKAGGCSGLSYDLNFDNIPLEDDEIFEDNGIKIVCDVRSVLYLMGTVLDFSDGINGKGFQFNNPNATRTCGCGESFSV